MVPLVSSTNYYQMQGFVLIESRDMQVVVCMSQTLVHVISRQTRQHFIAFTRGSPETKSQVSFSFVFHASNYFRLLRKYS